MLATSRTTPSAAPASSVMSGVLRFMWGPTQLEAQRVQYCAEVSQFSLTPDATGRATPRRRFPGQAGGEASGRCGGSRSGSWIPPPGTWRRPDLQSKDPGSRYTGYSTRVQQILSWSDDGRPAAARRPAHNRDDVTLSRSGPGRCHIGSVGCPPAANPLASRFTAASRGLPLMGCVGHCPQSDGVRGPPPPVDGGGGPLTSTGAGTRATHPGGHVRSAAAGALVTGAPDGRAAEPRRCDIAVVRSTTM